MPERSRQPGPTTIPAGGHAALVDGAAALNVAVGDEQARRLAAFADLLLHWNRAFNLISRRDTDRVIPRHLLDSLSVAPLIVGGEAMDVGTGAGLPGVPLAIVREDVRFLLVDRNQRKMRFVERAVRELGLRNVSTWQGELSALTADRTFDVVVCRAVADLGGSWTLASGRLRPGGRLVVMHRGQGASAADAALPHAACLLERRCVAIPGLDNAHEIIVLGRRTA